MLQTSQHVSTNQVSCADSCQATVTSKCLTTARALYSLQDKYKSAPVTVVSICAESNVVATSLAKIQQTLLQRRDAESLLRAHHDVSSALDIALTGCSVIYSCLDTEIGKIATTLGGVTQNPSATQKIALLWREEQLKELLDALRGQQIAITMLMQLFQMWAHPH